MTTDTTLRRGHYVETTEGVWNNLQKRFDLETVQRNIGNVLTYIYP